MKLKKATFQWKPFSDKQVKVLTWWMHESPHSEKDAIICDGAVRAGKTVAMAFSYVAWATETFTEQQFGMSGKTIGALRRNVIGPLKQMLISRGYQVIDRRADNYLIISRGLSRNYFYLFGGKDERSQDLIQGVTLAGMFFDEVALMPKSFVDQAVARCSVDGSKLWFNCNPAGPYHWFKMEWLDQREQKNALHLHFTMDDNLSLSEKIKERYKRMFSGVFYKRYILGLWVAAEGIIFDMFDEAKHKVECPSKFLRWYISVDYGTQNPTVFLLWGLGRNGKWYCTKEYYYDGRASSKQKTDQEYYDDLVEFAEGLPIYHVIVDPSAASFIATIRKGGQFVVKKAKNDVLEGIRNTATALVEASILFSKDCNHCFKEFASYLWDPKAVERGEEAPIKQNDHCMDAVRYFVNTMMRKSGVSFD
ncbi:PBSX family phage terminase large subunit [Paenibacillus larvae]|uniref:Phage terminase, large subunit, PBSX family n=1 Tax=Paenibacillus larvae subsp. larvae TaxID=147375 RepID=A0A6C0QTU4_9BACL|nr:PBSX family phage terminase large subunit [Paenibacillus larvae]QHZ52169.1 phage terminase, large subunit, PBSX family [Paenibacillus larvae subsp. larvae]